MADIENRAERPELITNSTFQGGVHNVKLVNPGEEDSVHPDLYVGVKEEEMTYYLPLDAPIYSKIFMYEPDEEDIANSGLANPKGV